MLISLLKIIDSHLNAKLHPLENSRKLPNSAPIGSVYYNSLEDDYVDPMSGVQSVDNLILTGFLRGADNAANNKKLTGVHMALLEELGRTGRDGKTALFRSSRDNLHYQFDVSQPADKKQIQTNSQLGGGSSCTKYFCPYCVQNKDNKCSSTGGLRCARLVE